MNFTSSRVNARPDRRMLQQLLMARNATMMYNPRPLASFLPPLHDMRSFEVLVAARSAVAPVSSAAIATSQGTSPTPLSPGEMGSKDNPNEQVSSSKGLELLRAASLRVPKNPLPKPPASIPKAPTVRSDNAAAVYLNRKPKTKERPIYIDKIRDSDILCGRGGKSNHHAGNKRYRQVVSEMKAMYRKTEVKTAKTDLSRSIVDHVCGYGGRFIKKDKSAGRYCVLSKSDARKKTSQALRETKTLKWTI